MSWLDDHPVTKATLEHSLRGGVSALVAAYAAGQIVWDGKVNVQELTAWFLIFVGGFVTSLLLSMGIHLKTGTGPALNKAESFQTKRSARERDQRGAVGLIELLIAVILILLILWAVGVLR